MNGEAASEPATPTAPSEDLDGIPAVAVIGGRRLYFEAFPLQARFRVTMAYAWAERTEALGSVIRLDTGEPGLRVCAPLEVEWAARHAEAIVSEAVRIWASITRDGEG
ncbi:hypothetical protein K3N28_12765 [Glycomyces sp. TRM65418]|uniref:hypothetical protein n=1 Tax=Glycomyces sp. TRM65418 TaxID=2867006 RepID=UPI001CE5F87C|nr:hypothetical protein [Glycomyces sp. TRM65418]MCC3763937.1 hypothetical protein [Glycomyces sp. TRM65418]QZD53637.1 hypothetical protein K3N28_12695 [Glycomyces sp. TRM65418]